MAKGVVQGSLGVLPGRSGLFARRWLTWEFLRGQAVTLDFERDGFRWSVFTDDVVGRGLFLNGNFQIDGLTQLLQWCRLNVNVWDQRTTLVNVGANIGATCLPLTRESGKRCLAVEPVPTTHAMLRRNVELNQYTQRITCCQAAIASQAGTVEMIAPRDSGHSEIRTADGKQGFSGTYEAEECTVSLVPALPLEQLIRDANLSPEQIALVWSDTQGFESEVIASGAALWKTGTPLWVEVWPHGLEMHGGVDRFLQECRAHFRHWILDDQFNTESVTEIELRPIDSLQEVIRELQQRGGRNGRIDHDVLLVP